MTGHAWLLLDWEVTELPAAALGARAMAERPTRTDWEAAATKEVKGKDPAIKTGKEEPPKIDTKKEEPKKEEPKKAEPKKEEVKKDELKKEAAKDIDAKGKLDDTTSKIDDVWKDTPGKAFKPGSTLHIDVDMALGVERRGSGA